MIKIININTEKLLLTKLGQKMLKKPMGFFDVGSLGGIHPITENFSNYLNVVCFEPNIKELENLENKNNNNNNNYAKIIYSEKALFRDKGTKILHIAKLDTNSSLLRASDEFIKRYQATNFETIEQKRIKTTTIDLIIDEELRKKNINAEFIKIDTQGTEYQILEGAKSNLKSNTVAILCEVEFFPLYENQKLFEDVIIYLRKFGFKLYGIYPNYRSNQKLNKKYFEYEERLIWGDAVFLWDPFEISFDKINQRRIESLILATLILGYYDYSYELNEKYNKKDKKIMRDLIKDFAIQRKKYTQNIINKLKNKSNSKNENYKLVDALALNRSYEK
jgi:FkbM family methyltransferase